MKIAFPEFLRELADFYDARPALPEPYWLQDDISVYLKEENARELLASIGSFIKEFDETYLRAKKEIGGRTLRFMTARANVCTRKVVGTRQVAQQVVPSSFTPERVIEAHEEEIVEWDCDSVLRPHLVEVEQAASAEAVILTDDEIPF